MKLLRYSLNCRTYRSLITVFFFNLVLCLLFSLCSIAFAQQQQVDLAQLSERLGISQSDFVTVTVVGNPRLSSTNANTLEGEPRLVLVEFSDVNCGYCIRFHKNTLPSILSDFVDTGKLDYVYKDYVSIGGQQSQDVALALRCLHADVGNQIYFEVLERLYRSPGRIGLERLFNIMVADLVDTQLLNEASIASIRDCIQTKQYFDAFSIENMEAEAIGVVGTPVYVLGIEGLNNQQGRVHGIFLPGYLQYEVLADHVQSFQTVLK